MHTEFHPRRNPNINYAQAERAAEHQPGTLRSTLGSTFGGEHSPLDAIDTSKGYAERSPFEDRHGIHNMLWQAQATIKHLEARVAHMKPKADAFDVIARMWRDDTNQAGLMGADQVVEIQRMTERMEREFEREKRMDRESEETASEQ